MSFFFLQLFFFVNVNLCDLCDKVHICVCKVHITHLQLKHRVGHVIIMFARKNANTVDGLALCNESAALGNVPRFHNFLELSLKNC